MYSVTGTASSQARAERRENMRSFYHKILSRSPHESVPNRNNRCRFFVSFHIFQVVRVFRVHDTLSGHF